MNHFGFIGAAVVLLTFLVPAKAELAASATENGGTCEFRYTEKVRDQIVVPILKQKVPRYWQLFDFESPTVIQDGNLVELIMSPVKRGRDILYENDFVIKLNTCSLQIVDSYSIEY